MATSELAPMRATRGVTHLVASGNSIAPTTRESTYDPISSEVWKLVAPSP